MFVIGNYYIEFVVVPYYRYNNIFHLINFNVKHRKPVAEALKF